MKSKKLLITLGVSLSIVLILIVSLKTLASPISTTTYWQDHNSWVIEELQEEMEQIGNITLIPIPDLEEFKKELKKKFGSSLISFSEYDQTSFHRNTYPLKMNHIESISFAYASQKDSEEQIPVSIMIKTYMPINVKEESFSDSIPVSLVLPRYLDDYTLKGSLLRIISKLQYQWISQNTKKYELHTRVVPHPEVSKEIWSDYLRWSKDIFFVDKR